MSCFILCILFTTIFFLFPQSSFAVEDPLAVANNKIGIHILFPGEIHEAAALVNSNGGQWGYVTIPIQSSDRNIEKWQKFMDDAKQLNVIPLVRLATNSDYFNTKVWRKPTFEDILDFANFFNSLSWPTKNRYIIVFNEVNRADEWGGQINPQEYAQLLSYAVTIFKSKSQDFFIISAGLDNASANISSESMMSLDYMQEMNREVPGIFYQIDGMGSHSYPNPAFKSPPTQYNRLSISSYLFEKKQAMSLGSRDLPIFITETGWSSQELSYNTIILYYKHAFENVWNREKIVTITPFLLRASHGPFTHFSFHRGDGTRNELFVYFESMQKVKGQPSLSLISSNTQINSSLKENKKELQEKILIPPKYQNNKEKDELLSKSAVLFVKWLLKL